MNNKNKEQITRKDALKKMGTYAAFTALGKMVLLSPKAAQAGSQTPEPPKRHGNFLQIFFKGLWYKQFSLRVYNIHIIKHLQHTQ